MVLLMLVRERCYYNDSLAASAYVFISRRNFEENCSTELVSAWFPKVQLMFFWRMFSQEELVGFRSSFRTPNILYLDHLC